MYHDAGFYKNVNRDGSGGEAQAISELDGETLIDKAITWLSENAVTNGRYTLSLDENIEQSTTDLNDNAFHNAEGVTLFITTPDVTTLTDGEVRVQLNASSYIFLLCSFSLARSISILPPGPGFTAQPSTQPSANFANLNEFQSTDYTDFIRVYLSRPLKI